MTALSAAALRILAGLLEARTGQQLAPTRQWRIEATLRPLLRERGFASFDALLIALTGPGDATLADAVVDALLNNETSFFRDPVSFQLLNEALVERLRATAPERRRLRIWCAGCSTGQEAYSLAMMADELAAALPGTAFEIFATDVSASAITAARAGVYSQFEVQRGLPVRKLMRWFEQVADEDWRIDPSLRNRIRFLRSGLADAAPPGRFDLILCRNVLLYLTPERRRGVFATLADALASDGMLMLGAGETVLGQTERFVADLDYRGLYRRAAEPAAARRRLTA